MSQVNFAKSVAEIASALSFPGIGFFISFTFIVVIEVVVNTSIIVCPCDSKLQRAYGSSFLIVPAVTIAVVVFPWKLIKRRPSPIMFCQMGAKPLGFCCIWFIVGLLEGKYLRCITDQQHVNRATNTTVTHGHVNCEKNTSVTYGQLAGLYFWLVLVFLYSCRKEDQSISSLTSAVPAVWRCYHQQPGQQHAESLAELEIMYELEEKRQKEKNAEEAKSKFDKNNGEVNAGNAAGTQQTDVPHPQPPQVADLDDQNGQAASASGRNPTLSSAHATVLTANQCSPKTRIEKLKLAVTQRPTHNRKDSPSHQEVLNV